MEVYSIEEFTIMKGKMRRAQSKTVPSDRVREDQLRGNAGDPRYRTLETQLSTFREILLEVLSGIDSLKTSVEMGDHYPINLKDEVNRFEAELIRAALLQAGGNQTRAASLLATSASTLNYKIERLGLSALVR